MGEVVASGGSLALAELIDEHGPSLVADFQAWYGLRLADVLFEWSPREVLSLVEGLVAYGASMYVARVRGGDQWVDHIGWDTHRHAEADFYDLYVQAHTPEGKTPGKYPRPGSKPPPSQGIPFLNIVPRAKA